MIPHVITASGHAVSLLCDETPSAAPIYDSRLPRDHAAMAPMAPSAYARHVVSPSPYVPMSVAPHSAVLHHHQPPSQQHALQHPPHTTYYAPQHSTQSYTHSSQDYDRQWYHPQQPQLYATQPVAPLLVQAVPPAHLGYPQQPLLQQQQQQTNYFHQSMQQQQQQQQQQPEPPVDPSVQRKTSIARLPKSVPGGSTSSPTSNGSMSSSNSPSGGTIYTPASMAASGGMSTSPASASVDQRKARRYTCQCGKSFTTSGHLARHMRIHTGEKNYPCPEKGCDARFSRQDNCMQHYRTHQVQGAKRGAAVAPNAKSAALTSASTTAAAVPLANKKRRTMSAGAPEGSSRPALAKTEETAFHEPVYPSASMTLQHPQYTAPAGAGSTISLPSIAAAIGPLPSLPSPQHARVTQANPVISSRLDEFASIATSVDV
ncbi:uncharacterized protein V1518DRAFT_408790 [Limtongia smithiae]|uniref:uncharacterized protein n=1 Tax=Limtongia smithiae TaxID=1125753 RepID=UPI0034CF15CF